MQQAIREGWFGTVKAKGWENEADLGTKVHPEKMFVELRAKCGIVERPDRVYTVDLGVVAALGKRQEGCGGTRRDAGGGRREHRASDASVVKVGWSEATRMDNYHQLAVHCGYVLGVILVSVFGVKVGAWATGGRKTKVEDRDNGRL